MKTHDEQQAELLAQDEELQRLRAENAKLKTRVLLAETAVKEVLPNKKIP